LLSHQAAWKVAEGSLATQQTLNIAHSGCRVGVPPSEMQALVDSIDARIVSGELQLNDLDARGVVGVVLVSLRRRLAVLVHGKREKRVLLLERAFSQQDL